MSRDQKRLKRRNDAIIAEFVTLFEQGLRSEVIYDRLADKYYLSPATVADIVTRQVHR